MAYLIQQCRAYETYHRSSVFPRACFTVPPSRNALQHAKRIAAGQKQDTKVAEIGMAEDGKREERKEGDGKKKDRKEGDGKREARREAAGIIKDMTMENGMKAVGKRNRMKAENAGRGIEKGWSKWQKGRWPETGIDANTAKPDCGPDVVTTVVWFFFILLLSDVCYVLSYL